MKGVTTYITTHHLLFSQVIIYSDDSFSVVHIEQQNDVQIGRLQHRNTLGTQHKNVDVC